MDIIAEHADRVLVLEKGALKFSGTARQLFSDEAMTLNLGLELPEAVKIGRELNLGLCLTPTEVYEKLKKGAQRDE
jgi:energy-coupling factor transport system ATP-binding protein